MSQNNQASRVNRKICSLVSRTGESWSQVYRRTSIPFQILTKIRKNPDTFDTPEHLQKELLNYFNLTIEDI